MSTSRFRVHGDFDGAHEATVIIDRGAGLFTVRPLRRRKPYTLPLSEVARRVMVSIIKTEASEKSKTKPARKFLVKRGTL